MTNKRKTKYQLIWFIGLIWAQNLNSWPNKETIRQYPKTISKSIIAAWMSLYNWRQPNLALPSLQELNVVTFIPAGKSKDKNTAQDNVLKFLKNKSACGNLIINGTIYEIYRGIPKKINRTKKPISVYSGGFSFCNSSKSYAYSGYTAIKAGLIPGICVTFDFVTDTRKSFNFCQNQDLHCVKTVCNQIVEKNPHVSIILHGASKGAANNLRFLAELADNVKKEKCLKNIKAVICESPPISVKKALQRTPLSPITLALMRIIFPNYKPNAKTIMDAKKFPKIPVMIACLPKDTISDLDDVIAMHKHLYKNCNANIKLFISREDELRHGKIGKAKDYQKAVKSFLEKAC